MRRLLTAAMILAPVTVLAQQPPSSDDLAAEIAILKKRVEVLEKAQQHPAAAAASVAAPSAQTPSAQAPSIPNPGAPTGPSPAVQVFTRSPAPAAAPVAAAASAAPALPAIAGPGPLNNPLDEALERVGATSTPLAPGWLIHVLEQPAHPDQIPRHEVGTFVWDAQSPTSLGAYRQTGIAFNGGAAYLMTGWLDVRHAGAYQLGVEIQSPTSRLLTEDMRCAVAMQIGHSPLGEESTQLITTKRSSWRGDVDLKPGLYPMSVEIRCPGVTGRLAADRAVIETYRISVVGRLPGESEAHPMPAGLVVHAKE